MIWFKNPTCFSFSEMPKLAWLWLVQWLNQPSEAPECHPPGSLLHSHHLKVRGWGSPNELFPLYPSSCQLGFNTADWLLP